MKLTQIHHQPFGAEMLLMEKPIHQISPTKLVLEQRIHLLNWIFMEQEHLSKCKIPHRIINGNGIQVVL